MKKLLVFGCAVAVGMIADVCLGGTRTVAVTSSDAKTASVTLAIGGSSEARRLFVAQDTEDRGETPSAWASVTPVAYIAPNTTSYTWTMPMELCRKSGVVRFFLSPLDPSLPYDCRVAYINPTVRQNGLYYDTGFFPDKDTVVSLDYQIMETPDECAVFGFTGLCPGMFSQSGRAYVWVPGIDTNVATYVTVPVMGTTVGSTIANERHTLVFDHGITLEGRPFQMRKNSDSSVSYSSGFDHDTPPSPLSVRLFMLRNNAADPSSYTKASDSHVRIYGFSASKGGQPLISLKPCVKDGIPKFYDEVGGTFVEPSDRSKFTVGPLCDETLPDAGAEPSSALSVENFGLRPFSVVLSGHEATLTFEAGAFDKQLFVAYDPTTDRGASPSAWKQVRHVSRIPVATNEYVYAIPEEWRTTGAVLRFFLTTDRPVGGVYLYESMTKKSWSSAYVDSGIVPEFNTVVTVDCRVGPNTSEPGLFGCFNYLGLFMQGNRTFLSLPGLDRVGSGAPYLLPPLGFDNWENHRKILRVGKDMFELNGYRPPYLKGDQSGLIYTNGFTTATNVVTCTMPIFKLRNAATGADTKTGCADVDLYRLDIETNGVPARILLPAYSYWTGDKGLYDLVTGRILPVTVFNEFDGTGSGALPIADDTVENSVAPALTKSIAITAYDRAANTVELSFAGCETDLLLFAVYGKSVDQGETSAGWDDSCSLGIVRADETAKTVTTLPSRWFRRGGKIRFLFASAADHPFDRRLAYLSNEDGREKHDQYINTGIYPTADMEATIRAQHVIGDIASFGLRPEFYAFPHSGQNIYVGLFGSKDSLKDDAFYTRNLNKPIDQVEIYDLRISAAGVWFPSLDRQLKTAFSPTAYGPGQRPLGVFGEIYAGSGTTIGVEKQYVDMRVYSFVLRRGEETLMDLVPCEKDGVACAFDRVQRKYFRSASKNAFVAGPEVLPVACEHTALSVSELIDLPLAGAVLLVR